MDKLIRPLFLVHALLFQFSTSAQSSRQSVNSPVHKYNGVYKGMYAEHIAFPIGGLGAGMFCLEGTGAISHVSVRNNPEIFNEPPVFAAIAFKGKPGSARVLEGPVPG